MDTDTGTVRSHSATGGSARDDENDWGTRFIEHGLYPFASVAAPGFLLALMVWFVVTAFLDGLAPGIRSFAAVLLPLMALTFLVKVGKRPSGAQGHSPADARGTRIPSWAAFTGMLILAAATMQLLTVSTSVPIVELVISAAFSILVFVRTSSAGYVSYCLGIVLGALGYLVLFGVPTP